VSTQVRTEIAIADYRGHREYPVDEPWIRQAVVPLDGPSSGPPRIAPSPHPGPAGHSPRENGEVVLTVTHEPLMFVRTGRQDPFGAHEISALTTRRREQPELFVTLVAVSRVRVARLDGGHEFTVTEGPVLFAARLCLCCQSHQRQVPLFDLFGSFKATLRPGPHSVQPVCAELNN
jgi:hypothetical protein